MSALQWQLLRRPLGSSVELFAGFKKGPRQLVKMRSTESSFTYITTKNWRNDPARMELRKYDPIVRKHVLFRETR